MTNDQFAGFNDAMFIAICRDKIVALPSICAYHTSLLHMVGNETNKAFRGSVRYTLKTNSPHAFLGFTAPIFNRNDYQYFIFRTTATLSMPLAANKSLINFDCARKFFSSSTHHCTSQPMKPFPCRVIAPQRKNSLKPQGVRPIFLARYMPHSLEPKTKWLTSVVKNSACRDGTSLPTAFAFKQDAFRPPKLWAPTIWATKSIGPTKCLQIAKTSLLARKSVSKLKNGSRIVFHLAIISLNLGTVKCIPQYHLFIRLTNDYIDLDNITKMMLSIGCQPFSTNFSFFFSACLRIEFGKPTNIGTKCLK